MKNSAFAVGAPAADSCRWETPNRYYEARVERDLFGESILLAINGGKNSHRGMARVVAVGDGIPPALASIAKRRRAHGYVQVR